MDVVAAAVLAVAVGGVVGWRLARRRDVSPPPVTEHPERIGDVDRLTAVLEGLSVGVVLADSAGAVRFRNAAARSLAGTHAGVLIDETVERHLRVAHGGATADELVELYGPPKMVLVVRAAPIPGDGSFAFVQDISERRRIDSVRTDFVANIGHELKTPVGALAVLAETLADENDLELVRRIAERMLEEAHRASRTIDDLLELSRIELGGEQQREQVDAGEIMRRAVERAEALAETRHIRITTLDVDPPLTVTGDRRQLVSALGNLVENAVKYSERSGLVQLRAWAHGPWVEFMVADQGVGIPSRDLDRIFERFYRVDKARSRDTGGTGLGLSIVRHVATNHGGEVLVESREGEGSTFVLRIPSAVSERPERDGNAVPTAFDVAPSAGDVAGTIRQERGPT